MTRGRRQGLSEKAERTDIVAEMLYRKQQLGVNEIVRRLRMSKVTLWGYFFLKGGFTRQAFNILIYNTLQATLVYAIKKEILLDEQDTPT